MTGVSVFLARGAALGLALIGMALCLGLILVGLGRLIGLLGRIVEERGRRPWKR